MLYLVRHAKAGSRSEWRGDDRLRPLSRSGTAQAAGIAALLTPLCANGRLVSSPYLRCVQTLEPLGAALDTVVEPDNRLAEDRSFEGVLDLLLELPDGSALCSHGDVIPETIAALERRGCQIVGAPDWRKGSIWVLTPSDDGEEIVTATAWPPPAPPSAEG